MQETHSHGSSLRFAAALAALLLGCSGSGDADGIGNEGQGGDGAQPGPSTGASNPQDNPAAACSIRSRGIELSSGKATAPAIVSGGNRFALTWTSLDKDAGDIHFALVDAAGKKVKETPIDVGPAAADYSSVTPTADGYFVLWQVPQGTGATVLGRYLAGDGAPIGEAFTVAQSTAKEARPNAVLHGGKLVVAWTDTPASFVASLHGTAVGDKRSIDQGTDPALATAGDALGVVWVAGSNIGFSRLSLPLGPLAPVMFRNGAGRANVPRIAAHEDASFDITWEDNRSGEGAENVYFTHIDPAGMAKGELAIPAEAGSANLPDVAWLGNRAAVTYYQFRDGPSAVYLSLVRRDLTMDADELQVSDKAPARLPRLAWTGSTLGVAYAEKDGPVRLSLVDCH